MDNQTIWVMVEYHQNKLAQVGLEIIGKVTKLAENTNNKVVAVTVGGHEEDLDNSLLQYGVDEVLKIRHPLLASYCNNSFAKALTQAVAKYNPNILLMGASKIGTDLAPRLAARLRTGLSAHCVDLEITPERKLLAVVPGWGGSVMAKISCPRSLPQMATVMPGVFDPPPKRERKGEVVTLQVDIDEKDLHYQVISTCRQESKQSELDTAEVVVAGGWGIGSAEDWQLVESLAQKLGGAVGATRPVVDEGWANEKQMIGTSGKSVSPKLYIGVALSGNPHHTVGLKKVPYSIAINKDPQAAIFGFCDLGICGDFKKIVPKILKRINS